MSGVSTGSAPRLAVPADAARLAALDALVNPSPWNENQFAAACDAGANGGECALVIESDGQLQGFVVYSLVLDEACIQSIAVAPSQRGRGLAQSLLHAALRRARAGGAVHCHLEVRASNEAARCLYEKLAFERVGVRPGYYPTRNGREDALLMSRRLAGDE